MYHSIATETTRTFARLTVDPSLFDEHLAALREQRLDVIPFSEVPSALEAGRQAVAITIDDGLADAADGAAPALLRYGLPATFFIPTAFIGTRASWLRGEDAMRPSLSWSAIDDMARAGFEIGSHGKRHLAADLNDAEIVHRDAAESRAELEQGLGRGVPSFAYPFGYHAARARRAVREIGFAQACIVSELPVQEGDDRWALPRLTVAQGTTPEALLAMVRSRPTGANRYWTHSKQRVWHLGRRLAGWGPPEAGRMTTAEASGVLAIPP
ncbi:MAG: polysaccharide deacetylase family protein [Trebonia sp.]|jgi:peptidoglycan/xylan/chitin deacetylase (PgdA/CDA1 family)